MALGDFGSVLNEIIFEAANAPTSKIVKISTGIVAIFLYSGTTNGTIKTYPIAADGTIGAMIDSHVFDSDAGAGNAADVIRISGNIYAIAYNGLGSGDGYTNCKVKTISIDSAGNIGSVIDTLVVQDGSQDPVDTYSCSWSRIIHISGNVYAVTYHTSAHDPDWGAIETISIDSDGDNITAIDSASVGNDESYLCLLKVVGTIYLLTSSGAGGSNLQSIVIANDGTIGSVLDTISFEMAIGRPQIVHIDGSVYAVNYWEATSVDGFFKTFSIPVDVIAGITQGAEDSFTVSGNRTGVYLPGKTFKVIGSTGNDGSYTVISSSFASGLTTIVVIDVPDATVDGTIVVDIAFIAVREWNVLRAHSPDFIKIMDNGSEHIVAIAYQAVGTDGWVTTYVINSDGTIATSAIGSIEFEDFYSYDCSITHVRGNIYAIAAHYDAREGHLYTIDIESAIVYPSDPLTRVTGIRHFYRPGMFRMMLNLGDVSNTVEIPAAPAPVGTTPGVVVTPIPGAPPVVVPSEEVVVTPIPGAEPVVIEHYVCPICGKEFSTLSALSMHDMTAHPAAAPQPPGPPPMIGGGGVIGGLASLEQAGLSEYRRRKLAEEQAARARRRPGTSLWSRLTPWKEEAGETFASWLRGLF